MWKDNTRHLPSCEEGTCRRLSFHRCTGVAGAARWRESVRYIPSGKLL
jgi:hypothetical protein